MAKDGMITRIAQDQPALGLKALANTAQIGLDRSHRHKPH